MRLGRDVQLFASGDSKTSAKLAGWCEIALRLNPAVRVSLSYHMIMLDEVCRMIDEFGVLHFRIDVIHPLDIHDIADRTLTTLHGRLDLPNLAPFHAAFLPLVSIFNERQNFLNNENWPGTIQHGLPPDLLPFCPTHQSSFAFLGRISPEKRPHRAIEIAARNGMPLKIAAKVDRADYAYWREKVHPMVVAGRYRGSNRSGERSYG